MRNPMRPACACLIVLSVCSWLSAAPVTENVEVEGKYVRLTMTPSNGAVIVNLGFVDGTTNLVSGGGLLQEGFGAGSRYVPNRRLNERIEMLNHDSGRPMIEYAYDCDGPNIKGLHVLRLVEPFPDEASIRVTWTLENKGIERQWVAPWVRNEVAPGGAIDASDQLIAPTLDGIQRIRRIGYYPMARNWVAATDPATRETVYAVFDANQLHSILGVWSPEKKLCGFQAAFVPRMLAPGESWTTTYRINAVRGLNHVDFASDEFAAQIDYASGKLTALLASARSMEESEIHARAVAPNGEVSKLIAKKFSIDPARLIRCTYLWTPAADGAYEFLAQLRRAGAPVLLGNDTASPHGGIDTQFVVGKPKDRAFEAWTDAPYALERGARKLRRTLAARSDVAIWAEPSLEKVFPDDQVEPVGQIEPTVGVSLARNEYESFQLVLRAPEGRDLFDVSISVNDLVNESANARIPASDIRLSHVAYVPVRIPSYFEGPTGLWPDPLPPIDMPFHVAGGQTTPIWFTMHAQRSLPGGVYRGLLELQFADAEPIEITLEARVFDFELPVTPALKTDFGFSMDAALRGAKLRGGNPSREALARAYLENALAHRVTLRELVQLPADPAAINAQRIERLLASGATSISVPVSLLDAPAQLAQVNALVKRERLQKLVFAQLADEPGPDVWSQVIEKMASWKTAAPDIPIMVTTAGLDPFLPENLDICALHTPVVDTINSGLIVKRILDKKETWCYVDESPARPYANLFVDFAGIEHRILCWQASVLGFRGMHYWSINYSETDQDPWKNQLDATPVNGDGCLVYPGANGPVNAIRWEILRDGIEDYDYLSLLSDLSKRLENRSGATALVNRAKAAFDLKELVPDLMTFARDSHVLLEKRVEIGALIEEMLAAM